MHEIGNSLSRSRGRWASATLLVLSTVACQNVCPGGTGNCNGGSGGTGGGASLPPISWQACQAFSEEQQFALPPSDCAYIDVPLRWKEPDGEKIQILIKRYRRLGATRQVYLLEGGPGGSVLGAEPMVPTFANRGNADVYLFEHRGIGLSKPRLACPDQEAFDSPGGLQIIAAEMPACVAHLNATFGDRRSAYTTTEAARDLGYVAARLRESGKRTFVWGVSYGAYLANRYLQLFPEQPDGVVMDSVVPPWPPNHGSIPIDYENNVEAGAKRLFEACASDAVCGNKLGPFPIDAVRNAEALLEQGHCPALRDAGLDLETLKTLLAGFAGSPQYQALAPAVVYRLTRCAPGDVSAISALLKTLHTPPTPSDFMALAISPALADNINRGELAQDPGPAPSEFAEFQKSHLFAAFTPDFIADLYAYPFHYAPDEYMGKVASTEKPMLILSGTMDFVTSLPEARAYAQHFQKPHQNWVVVERATHVVTTSSTLANNPADSCAWQLYEQFLRDPQGALNTSCRTMTQPLDFSGNPISNWLMLGTGDLYENP